MPSSSWQRFADPVADIRESVAAETGTSGFADIPSMLAGADLDAVYIATPTELHADHAGMAFTAGKHVLTEKPMAIRLDEAQAMIAAAERAGVSSWSAMRTATTGRSRRCARLSPAAGSAACA